MTEPTLSSDRMLRRQEHLMQEIILMTPEAPTSASPARHSRRRYRMVLASLVPAGIAAAVAVALLVPSASSPGRDGLQFQQVSRTTVAVHVVDSSAAASDMTRQLQRRGLNVKIDAVPVSPQLVGTWVSSSFGADIPEDLREEVIAQVRGYVVTVDLPTKLPDWIRLAIGRAARPGEQVDASGWRNALAPGGRLGCLHATDGDPIDVAQRAEALGYHLSWAIGDQRDPSLLPVNAPPSGLKVVDGYINDDSPADVQLVIATPGTVRYETEAKIGYAPSQWPDRATIPATCTPASA